MGNQSRSRDAEGVAGSPARHQIFSLRKSGAGFTLAEFLVVIGVIALLSTISVISLQNFGDYASLRTATDGVSSMFADARNRTLASENDAVYGVRIDTGEVVRFTGASYSSTSPENVAYALPAGVRATSSLTGGLVEIVFARLTGEPSATGTITLTLSDNSASTTLTLHGSGLIE